MTDTLLPQLVRTLDLAVVERQPDGRFHALTVPPAWLERAFEAAPAGGQQSLDSAFLFLDDVLHQALGAWQAGPHASIVFGPFSATVDGDDLLLRVTALTIDSRPLLVLERMLGAADTRPMLQKARERMLEGEDLVRKVTALHAPVAEVDQAVAALLAGTLAADHQALADALGAANARLQAAMIGLPAPAPRRRR